MTKIELIGEVLKVCDEKEKLEVDNEILRKSLMNMKAPRAVQNQKKMRTISLLR